MYGQGRYAAVLQLFGKSDDHLAVAIPAEASLHGDGNLHRVDHRASYLKHFGDIAQHACTCAFACNFLYRTSEIDVEDIGLCGFYNAGGFYHRLYFAAVDLYCRRALAGGDVEFAGGGGDVANEGVGRYKFGIGHVGSLLFADEAEGCVGDIFHRGKHYGAVSKFDCTYSHIFIIFVKRCKDSENDSNDNKGQLCRRIFNQKLGIIVENLMYFRQVQKKLTVIPTINLFTLNLIP